MVFPTVLLYGIGFDKLVWWFRCGGARGFDGGSVSAVTLCFGVGLGELVWWI
jgi:hypothetical protein